MTKEEITNGPTRDWCIFIVLSIQLTMAVELQKTTVVCCATKLLIKLQFANTKYASLYSKMK